MVVSASTSFGHQHHQVHLPVEPLQAAGVSMTSLTSLSKAFPGILPPSKLGSMALDTLKKQVIVSHARGNSIPPFTPKASKSVLSC